MGWGLLLSFSHVFRLPSNLHTQGSGAGRRVTLALWSVFTGREVTGEGKRDMYGLFCLFVSDGIVDRRGGIVIGDLLVRACCEMIAFCVWFVAMT